MSIGGAFRALGEVFDHWEGQHWTISHVGADDGTTITEDGVGTVVELEAPLHAALGGGRERPAAAESVGVGSDGALEFAIRLPLVPDDVRPAGLQMEATEVRATADDTLVVGLVVSIPSSPDSATDPGTSTSEPSTNRPSRDGQSGEESGKAQVRNAEDERPDSRENAGTDDGRIERHRPDVPPFEDTAYLREVYETHDTFAEMAAELDMDVTAETVRRYMIDAGIHEPTRYNTGSDSAESDASSTAEDRPRENEDGTEPLVEPEAGGDADGTPVLVTDGIGLPEGLSVEEFIEIVKNSRTLYEVQREMGVEREAARDLLKEYNLLDFVMGQLACESELYVTREEVIARIRESGLA